MESTPENIAEYGRQHPIGVDRLLAAAADPQLLAGLDADGLVDLLVEVERGARAIAAARYRVLAALSRHPVYGRGPVRDAAVEVACALRISERTAEAQVAQARVLARVFPEALGALAAGRVQGTQVRCLIEATGALDDDVARVVQERVLGRMPEQSPAATRKALSRAVLKADPQGAVRRHEAAREDRRVAHYPESDGMSVVSATLPAERAVHAMAVIDAHARTATQEPGDVRTLEQARADSFYQLVTGCHGAYPAAVVQVTVGLDMLLGLDELPGELCGYGPITAHTARMLAAGQEAVWRRLLTAPACGLVVKTDPYSYRPTAEVRRQVSARQGHCSFPHCAMPAARTDLDHVIAFNHQHPEHGGPTTPENLQPLCRNAGELGFWVGCQEGVCGRGGFVDDPGLCVFGELDAQAGDVRFVEVFGDLERSPDSFGLVA
jgi:Domain of unknown function (DUF222)